MVEENNKESIEQKKIDDFSSKKIESIFNSIPNHSEGFSDEKVNDEKDNNVESDNNIHKSTTKANQENRESKKDNTPEKNNDFENLNKRFYETRNFATVLSQNKKEAIKSIMSHIEEGDIDSEVGEKVIAILNRANAKEPQSLKEKTDYEDTPIRKYMSMITPEIVENYLDYSEDSSYYDKAKAFGAFIADASEEEIEEITTVLESTKDRPLAMLKKMLSFGEQYMSDGFSDLMKDGGFRAFTRRKNEEIANLNKMVDKLQKKLQKFSQYDEPSSRLVEQSYREPANHEKRQDNGSAKAALDELFDPRRDRSKYYTG